MFFLSTTLLESELVRIFCQPISILNPIPPSDAVRKQEKKYCRGSFQFSIVKIKKYHPSRNLKFGILGIFQKLKIA